MPTSITFPDSGCKWVVSGLQQVSMRHPVCTICFFTPPHEGALRRSYVRKSHRRCLGFFLHVNFRDPICYLYAKLKHTLRLAAVLLSVPRCPLHKKSCLFHSSEIVKIKVMNTVTYQNQLYEYEHALSCPSPIDGSWSFPLPQVDPNIQLILKCHWLVTLTFYT